MSLERERLAGLYYRSGTLKVDLVNGFKMSIHRDNPDLPLSPWYMHYPSESETGYEYMAEIEQLAAAEWALLAASRPPRERTLRITGVPKGADGLGRAYAKTQPGYPYNYVTFEKVESADKRCIEFPFVDGQFTPGYELESCEDHITAARNNLRFIENARSIGFHVAHLNVVVDRQQGAHEKLQAEGVELHSIFTADEILSIGLSEGELTQGEYDAVQDYRHGNQY